MDIIGDRKFVEIPGEKHHELPPLMVHRTLHLRRLDKIMDMAANIVETEDMIAPSMLPEEPLTLEQRKFDLAVNLVEQYQRLVLHWRWGDDILEWIRQCEITFDQKVDLRHVLKGHVWPHAGRSSFVTLLEDKAVPTEGIEMEKAVGLRLTFRQPPPISCFSNQFLFYLNDSVGNSAYQAWASKNPAPVCALPPERFTVHVVEM
ncbi:MAG TPA: hypothetical protein VM120_20175 [Bryobacteraceae bacterium]|nr:hypothetical protein [Bryobacteraceae bacterium]